MILDPLSDRRLHPRPTEADAGSPASARATDRVAEHVDRNALLPAAYSSVETNRSFPVLAAARELDPITTRSAANGLWLVGGTVTVVPLCL